MRSLLLCFFLAVSANGQTAQQNLLTAAHKALAVTSGELRVAGLQKPVEVLRDRWGVAHIYAQNQHDLFFAQGFVAAQDRLFQMELWKRAGQGRLAELLGPSALQRDINARRLRYRGDMKKEFESYAPDTQAILTAFADGINAYIAETNRAGGPGLPVEFQLAGFAPDAWHPEDCLNRMAAFSMTGNAVSELEHAQAVAMFGAAHATELFDFDPAVALDPAADMDFKGLSPDLLRNLVGSDQRIQFPYRQIEGSNNWTISGALTESGKPLLANDPHRVIGEPSLRYMVHLVAPGWDVIGAGEPGLPGVALGHNQHIAWGFTIFGLDQQDLYVEELNPADATQYKTQHGWERMETRHETFKVKGAQASEVDLHFTVHGPVLWQDGKRALALHWVGAEPGTAGYLGSLAIDRAENWSQFEAAIPRWKVPSENLVYADREGNIGEHSAGLAPERSWTGLLPVPGAGKYEWKGFVPANELPHFFNPAEGFVATANHRMIPEHYPHNVGFEWASAYRIQRIRSVLEKAKQDHHKLTLADMQGLQTDVTSLPAAEFQILLGTTALKNDASLRSFLAWNTQLTRESTDAALFEVWLEQIRKQLASNLGGRPESRMVMAAHLKDLPPDSLFKILKNPSSDYFGAKAVEGRDQLLSAALHAAREELSRLLGPDESKWSWGQLHVVRFRHPVDQYPGAREVVDLGPVARPGDEYTVNATGNFGGSWEQVSGASYREILDPSDWDRSLAVNTPGQSGQPGSPHYADLLPLWDRGEYFPLVYSRKAVEAAASDRLTLKP